MKPTTRDGILRGGMAALIRLLILAAAGISGYLLSVSLSGGSAVGCAPGSACDAVLQSRWAYVLGIPVSALALIVDLALFVTTFSCGSKANPKKRRGAWELIVPCAVLLLGAALWFTALQAFVLQRFCPWCMTAHLCGAVAAILLLSRVPLTEAAGRRERDLGIPRSTVVKFAVAAIIAVAVLGVAQTVTPHKTHSVTTIPIAAAPLPTNGILTDPKLQMSPPPSVTSSAAQTNKLPANSVAAPRPLPTNVAALPPSTSGQTLDVLGGRFRLDLTQVPVWGSVDAPFKLLSLYDYTCHHCRDMHSRVAEVQRIFGNKLAVVSLPMPLDSQCNALMRGTPPAHQNACVYAKLGLMVWRAKHDAIEPFDDWIFSFPKPPPLIDVTNKAIELVGASAFANAGADPSLGEQLSTTIAIYGVSAREFRNGSMPQFMIGTNIVSGVLTTEELRRLVAKYVEPAAAVK